MLKTTLAESKMNKLKRFLTILITFVTVLTLFGCKNSDNSEQYQKENAANTGYGATSKSDLYIEDFYFLTIGTERSKIELLNGSSHYFNESDELLPVYKLNNGDSINIEYDQKTNTVTKATYVFAKDQSKQNLFDIDFEDVKGQENVKRAFEVAAAGGHNLIMIGPPGSGKSMLAKRIPTILPPLTLDEALETTKIHSVAGRLSESGALVTRRPFRSPHHTISGVALVGGGTYPQPGEISLAHNGVLFLDELPEFSRSVLEVMRQPLEDRKITISRAKNTVEYPAGIMLVASMNPCPCGYYNHPTKECICSEGAVSRYLNRISGPLLDRIDIQIEVVPVEFEKLSSTAKGESSSVIRERVIRAREMQTERFKDTPGVYCNAQMNTRLLNKWALPDSDSIAMLKTAMERFNLSARAYDRILKVARTIADLDGSERVKSYHIQEAITYRNLDRGNWGR